MNVKRWGDQQQQGIEDAGTIFEDHGMPRSSQEVFQKAAEGFGRHAVILPVLRTDVCDL